MNELILIVLAFLSGVLVERVYIARSKGLTELGKSWELTQNRFYQWLHRLYCETCPRRLYCPEYRRRVLE